MDLVADMHLHHLRQHHRDSVDAARLRPQFTRRFGALPGLAGNRAASNADRFLNRFVDYPAYLRREGGGFHIYHVVDHSYAHLVHELPAERTLVTCHDLDAFRCLLEPERDPRPWWFRRMARRTLEGLSAAARVICDSGAVRRELIRQGILPAERVIVVPLGVHPTCSPAADADGDARASALLAPPRNGQVELLHVGSTTPRKRIDVLLRAFARVRNELPEARLVRVGGPFTPAQRTLLGRLGLDKSVVVLPFVDRATLAALYRRATLVLQPSDSEGFGLPVAEALACGTPVLVSDLEVLREVAGDAAVYRQPGDIESWTTAIVELVAECREQSASWQSRKQLCLARGAAFSWTEHARRMTAVYRELLEAS